MVTIHKLKLKNQKMRLFSAQWYEDFFLITGVRNEREVCKSLCLTPRFLINKLHGKMIVAYLL
jgi:hypothetical protein